MCSSACARSHERDLASVSRHTRPKRAETEPCTVRVAAHLELGLHAQTRTIRPPKVMLSPQWRAASVRPPVPARTNGTSHPCAGAGAKKRIFLCCFSREPAHTNGSSGRLPTMSEGSPA